MHVRSLLTRRTFILAFIYGILFFVLIGRLFYLQIILGRLYRKLSDKNRLDSVFLLPNRGLVLDRMGQRLSYNIEEYQLLINPRHVKNVQYLIQQLQSIIVLPPKSLEILNTLSGRSIYYDVLIKEQLTWKEVSILNFYRYKLPELRVTPYNRRYYPYGDQFIHVVGYTGYPSKKEMNQHVVYREPGVLVGKTNIEKSWNTTLFGEYGVRQDEVNASGSVVRVMNVQPKQNGKNVVLTPLLEVQNAMHQRLIKERAGASVVMDIHNGQILALDSTPSIDPNILIAGVGVKQWKQWQSMQSSPFINRAIGEGFSPGSAFKIVSGLAVLQKNISPYETEHCPGHFDFGGRRFYCWKRSGHGVVDFHKAIVQSCDVYFYKMSLRVGIDNISNMARKLGYAKSYDLGLDGSIQGIIPSKSWKKERFGLPWRLGETLIASIGQGYITVSLLQMVVMLSRVLTGKAINPLLVKQNESLSQYASDINIPTPHLQRMMRAMVDVVNTPHGTAHLSAFRGWGMGGKTGTAQVRESRGNRNEEADETNMPWKYRDNSIFIGFTPKHKPKYAIATLTEHGGSGAGLAAHITQDIAKTMERMYKKYNGKI